MLKTLGFITAGCWNSGFYSLKSRQLALGTTPARLRAFLLWQGLLPIGAGAVPGVVAAVLSGRFLESLVDGARGVSAPAYLAAVLFIAGVAATGIWTATRPVTRLDIVEILRSE